MLGLYVVVEGALAACPVVAQPAHELQPRLALGRGSGRLLFVGLPLISLGPRARVGGDALPAAGLARVRHFHLDSVSAAVGLGVPSLGWKLLSCSLCQELGQKAN